MFASYDFFSYICNVIKNNIIHIQNSNLMLHLIEEIRQAAIQNNGGLDARGIEIYLPTMKKFVALENVWVSSVNTVVLETTDGGLLQLHAQTDLDIMHIHDNLLGSN